MLDMGHLPTRQAKNHYGAIRPQQFP